MNKTAVLQAVDKGAFWERLCHLYMKTGDYMDMEMLEGRSLRHATVFLSDVRRQYDQLKTSQLWTEYLSLADCRIVEQTPLAGSKIAVMLITSDSEAADCTTSSTTEGLASADFGRHIRAHGYRVTGGSGENIQISVSGCFGEYGDDDYSDDAKTLTGRMLGAVGLLLKEGGATMNDVDCFEVCLSDISDFHDVDKLLQTAFPYTPRIILQTSRRQPDCDIEIRCGARHKSR